MATNTMQARRQARRPAILFRRGRAPRAFSIRSNFMDDLLITDSLSAATSAHKKKHKKERARQERSSRAPVMVSG
jgi:hypothetical protein